MKHIFCIICLFFVLAFESQGQNYDLAVGARFGANSGVSVRKNIGDYWAGEVMLAGYKDASALAFLLERQTVVEWFPDFPMTAYYGFGAHLGVGTFVPKFARDYPYYGSKRTSLRMGIDAVLGLEYRIPQYPFALSAETKPYYEFFGGYYSGFYIPAIAFSIKYILK